MKPKRALTGFFLLAVLCTSFASNCHAQASGMSTREASRQYSGLLCVYAAAKQHGAADLQFDSLIDADLLTGRFGSSAANILEALHRCGIKGYPRAGMTVGQLDALSQPALLRVGSPVGDPEYRSWVLYLGKDESGRIHLYDPPRSRGTLSAAELLSVLDGVAVMTEPPPLGSRVPDPGFPGLSVLCVIGAAFLGRKLTFGKLLISLVALVSMAASLIPQTGIARSPLALGSVQARFFDASFPDADYETLRTIMKQPHVLIDARTSAAYDSGHIPGAINIPVNSVLVRFCTAAQSIGDDIRVVIYCQGERCAWGDKIATQLYGRGVKNIQIYRGGMSEWTAREQ